MTAVGGTDEALLPGIGFPSAQPGGRFLVGFGTGVEVRARMEAVPP